MKDKFHFDRLVYIENIPHPIEGSVRPLRMGGEIPLGPDDDPQEAWAWAEQQVNQASDARSKRILLNVQQGETRLMPRKEPAENTIAALIADIYSCQELKVLESYRIMVKKDQQLQAAYNQMFEKLSK